MFVMNFALRWSWLLGIALFLPLALPARDRDSLQPEICYSEYSNPIVISSYCSLKGSPFIYAPNLRSLDIGTPLKVLRRWTSEDGQEWTHVQLASNERMEFSSLVRRGWLNVSNF